MAAFDNADSLVPIETPEVLPKSPSSAITNGSRSIATAAANDESVMISGSVGHVTRQRAKITDAMTLAALPTTLMY